MPEFLSERKASLSVAKRILLEKRLRGEQVANNRLHAISSISHDQPLPLSFAQQRLWFLHQLRPESAAYNLPVAVTLTGKLDINALERALKEVVRRHKVLRTHFESYDGDGRQVIEPAWSGSLDLVDLRSQPKEEQQEIT